MPVLPAALLPNTLQPPGESLTPPEAASSAAAGIELVDIDFSSALTEPPKPEASFAAEGVDEAEAMAAEEAAADPWAAANTQVEGGLLAAPTAAATYAPAVPQVLVMSRESQATPPPPPPPPPVSLAYPSTCDCHSHPQSALAPTPIFTPQLDGQRSSVPRSIVLVNPRDPTQALRVLKATVLF